MRGAVTVGARLGSRAAARKVDRGGDGASNVTPDDIAKVVRWCALGGGHPLGWTDAQGGGGGGFASEASLPLRIRALAAGVEALERAEVSHAELTAFRKSLARLHVVAVVRDAMPSLVADSLRMLDDDAFILAAVAEQWVAAGEPLRHVAGLVAAGRKHTGHEGGDADHVDACAKALNAATRALTTAFDGQGSADARTAAVNALRAIVTRSLRDDSPRRRFSGAQIAARERVPVDIGESPSLRVRGAPNLRRRVVRRAQRRARRRAGAPRRGCRRRRLVGVARLATTRGGRRGGRLDGYRRGRRRHRWRGHVRWIIVGGASVGHAHRRRRRDSRRRRGD